MTTKLIVPFVALAAVTGFNAVAEPTLDPTAAYSCVVMESNDKNIPVGAKSISPITLKTLESGAISLKSGSDTALIDFYGPLKPYDLQVAGSGLKAYAVPPTEPREINGSIVVDVKENRSIELAVKVFPTTRAFDSNGEQAFLLADSPQVYKLSCRVD